MNTEHTDIYTRITDQIIAALEKCSEANSRWKRPWHCPNMENVLPMNAKTGLHYRGVNVIALWATAQELNYINGLWATFRQWQELGAQVRKGEKSSPVVFWSSREKKGTDHRDTTDPTERDTLLFAKTYHVFNVSQVDGYQEPTKAPLTEDRLLKAEQYFSRVGVTVREATKAFYRGSDDTVYMPPFASFFCKEGYYATLSHEVTHWTGHETRLNRDMKNRFGDDAYALEELVAELGAAFLCAELNVSNEPREDHAVYIKSWLKVLKQDKREIFSAASKAQAACDWLSKASQTERKAA